MLMISDASGTIDMIQDTATKRRDPTDAKAIRGVGKRVWKLTAWHLQTCERCHSAGADTARPSELCSTGSNLRRAWIALDAIEP